jgi:16S rRNA (guanine(966)-N(2))-methyltransferase RsmD
MRIIAGTARGRPLEGPKNSNTIRPTADRVRETIFNVLGQWMEGQTVLDLFAGTGALGLEAVSRGATHAVLVDQDREAVRLCQGNARALGFEPQVEVMSSPVERALGQLGRAGRRFDLVFADPPYAVRGVLSILEQVDAAKVMAPGGRLCIEHDKREDASETQGTLTRVDQRSFGDTRVSLYAAA